MECDGLSWETGGAPELKAGGGTGEARHWVPLNTVVPRYLGGGSRTSTDLLQMLKSLVYNKMAQYLHITYAHPSVYFKSPLDY